MSRRKGTGSIFKPKGSRFWWIIYTSGGKRYFEGTRSEKKSDAQALLTSRLGDTQRGIVVTPKVGRIKLADGLKAVINNLRMNDKDSVVCARCKVACCGVEGHSNHIQRLIDKHIVRLAPNSVTGYFNPDRLMSSITTSDLTAYASHRLAQGASASSVNHELATIRRAFRLALRGRELVSMPHVPMLKLDNVRTGFLERDQFEAVRAALPEELRGIVTLAYYAGWRVASEVLPLQWSQVDRDHRVIRLEPGTTKNRDGRTLPYGGLPELITVIDVAWASHEALKKDDQICPFVFHRGGTPVKNLRGAWEAACVVAGCPGKLLHDLRRTAVRNLVRRGVPEKQAMKITGHKTRSVFDRYDIVTEADLRDALGKLSDVPAEKLTGTVTRFRKHQQLKNG